MLRHNRSHEVMPKVDLERWILKSLPSEVEEAVYVSDGY